jgi:Tfp pilus assembly protein PilX
MRRIHPRQPLARQRGATLIVGLIMLVLITLLALTTYNMSRSGIQVVTNMQAKAQGETAARQVIEETISSTQFFSTPTNALNQPCDGELNTRCVDVNGDGTQDVKVALTPAPACLRARSVMNTQLNVSDSEDVGCALGASQSFGVAGSVTGESLCSDSLWELHAVATDTVTEATVEVTQGVAVRVARDDVETSCPN